MASEAEERLQRAQSTRIQREAGRRLDPKGYAVVQPSAEWESWVMSLPEYTFYQQPQQNRSTGEDTFLLGIDALGSAPLG